VGIDDGAEALSGDGLHRTSVHRRADVPLPVREQGRSEGAARGRVEKYATACARNRPVDSVFQQKMFFEVVKQYQGEYLGSLLSAVFESMGGTARPDGNDFMLGDAIDAGLADAVNDNDAKFPPEFRLSKSRREQKD
jgi:hypothetical protein